MEVLATVRVVSQDFPEFPWVIINEGDFNAAVHRLYVEPVVVSSESVEGDKKVVVKGGTPNRV
jgi:hypothetical protein